MQSYSNIISGLPRSGSMLLARQNQALHAGMSSPLLSPVQAMLRGMSQENEGAPFLDDAKREAVLRGVVAGCHADLGTGVTAVDTNRGWAGCLDLLAGLFLECCRTCRARQIRWMSGRIDWLYFKQPCCAVNSHVASSDG